MRSADPPIEKAARLTESPGDRIKSFITSQCAGLLESEYGSISELPAARPVASYGSVGAVPS